MLRVFSSNRTERLAAQLLARIVSSRPDSVFEPIEIVVPSAGLRRYLTLAMAETSGICANLRFDFLAAWQWRMIRQVLPGVPETSPFATQRLAWRIYRAFGDGAFTARHPRLHGYLTAADPAMRLELAQRTAGIFDQYVTYRQDWLAQWRKGKSVLPGRDAQAGAHHAARLAADALADERWQAELWRWLNEDLGVGGVHPARAFIDELEKAGPTAAARFGLPAQAHLFLLPDMAPLHRELVIQLGRWLNLDLYLLDPCEAYWQEIESPRRIARLAARGRAEGVETGNRLLASWGRQTQTLVAGLASAADAVAGFDSFDSDTDFELNEADTLLAQVQNSILELTELEPESIALAPDDRSLELHVCHSLTRELEVLQDRLLGLFRADPSLQPADVLVTVPDIDAAAPLIEAVFGAIHDARRIPFTLTGRAARDRDGPQRALAAVLELASSRVTAADFYALLQQPIVARRYGLDDEALDRIHQWLLGAGFRWGLDAAHRASYGLPSGERHTLADAIERLLLGYASPEAMTAPFAGRVAVAGIEGGEALALGALWQLQQRLTRLRDTLARPHLPADWGRISQQLIDDFLAPERDEAAATRDLRATLASLIRDMVDGAVDEAVPFKAWRAALLRALTPAAPGGVPGGAVTFTAMNQLRGLPYRIVCLLGLDHGAFPKAVRPAEFDLMAQLPRAGDRQRRDDDRNLFLDLIMACREVLHLSHSGRSVIDNAELPASAVVSELLDVLLPALLADDQGRLVIEHPLQAFSAEIFREDADPRRRSHHQEYAQALAEAARAAQAATPLSQSSVTEEVDDADDDGDEARLLPVFVTGSVAAAAVPGDAMPGDAMPGDATVESVGHAAGGSAGDAAGDAADKPVRVIRIDDLVRFFRDPAEAFLRQRLGMELPRERSTLLDDEPIVPGADEQRSLAARLLPTLIAADPPLPSADLAALARAGGEWPEGLIGATTLPPELAELSGFATAVRLAQGRSTRAVVSLAVSVDIDGEPWRIEGAQALAPDQGLLNWRYGRLSGRDALDLWIRHLWLTAGLATAAAPLPGTARSRHLARDGALIVRPTPEAATLLADLLRLRQQGLSAPLPFYPRAAWQLTGQRESLEAVRRKWLGGHHQAYAESQQAAVRQLGRGRILDLDEDFADLANRIFGPLLAARDEGAEA